MIPVEVSELSDDCFRVLASHRAGNSGYVFKGHQDYVFPLGISAKEVIHTLSKQVFSKSWCCSLFKKYKVLDIGTGDGRFIENMPFRIKAYGITATPMRHAAPDDRYRICNAERLSREFPSNHFDFIVSHLAFMHMVDPLTALKEAYKVLKPGGFLLIDRFQLKGVNVDEWIKQMRENGYEIAAIPGFERDNERSSFRFLMMRKTKDRLETAIDYLREAPISERSWNRIKRAHYCLPSAIPPIVRIPKYTDDVDPSLIEEEPEQEMAEALAQLDEWGIPHRD
ncbi:MAG: class I SAM-dependent methyltransferase [Parachlamydiales bacterium]|nr:class I SAM-dependent methyltransferase [Parachlamydiales bacterium]